MSHSQEEFSANVDKEFFLEIRLRETSWQEAIIIIASFFKNLNIKVKPHFQNHHLLSTHFLECKTDKKVGKVVALNSHPQFPLVPMWKFYLFVFKAHSDLCKDNNILGSEQKERRFFSLESVLDSFQFFFLQHHNFNKLFSRNFDYRNTRFLRKYAFNFYLELRPSIKEGPKRELAFGSLLPSISQLSFCQKKSKVFLQYFLIINSFHILLYLFDNNYGVLSSCNYHFSKTLSDWNERDFFVEKEK